MAININADYSSNTFSTDNWIQSTKHYKLTSYVPTTYIGELTSTINVDTSKNVIRETINDRKLAIKELGKY